MLYSTEPAGTPVIVVEGPDDCRTLAGLVDSSVKLYSAGGKSAVIGARRAQLVSHLEYLFIVDCDGEDNSELLGHDDVIVTERRDLESDLMFGLEGLRAAVFSLLGNVQQPSQIWGTYSALLDLAEVYSSKFTLAKNAAREQGIRVRTIDPQTNLRRKLRLDDLPGLISRIGQGVRPRDKDIVIAISRTLGWSRREQRLVLLRLAEYSAELCTRHSLTKCHQCLQSSHCNGHDMQTVMAIRLSDIIGRAVTAQELAEMVRQGVDKRRLLSWDVAQRIRLFEAKIGQSILAS